MRSDNRTPGLNQSLVSVFALVLVVLLGVAVYLAATDRSEGLGFFAAPLENRVSAAYILKNADEPGSASVVEPGGRGYENGSANIVTAVVVDYRMWDTFGEVLVLFAAAAGVTLLMEGRRGHAVREASPIVQTATPIIMLFASVVGAYIVLHGHLTPGGGFPGGAVLASAFIIGRLARRGGSPHDVFKTLETLAGFGLMAVGIAGLYLKGSLFQSFLPAGALGATLSAGTTMVLYGLVGLKVGAELSSIGASFIGEGE